MLLHFGEGSETLRHPLELTWSGTGGAGVEVPLDLLCTSACPMADLVITPPSGPELSETGVGQGDSADQGLHPASRMCPELVSPGVSLSPRPPRALCTPVLPTSAPPSQPLLASLDFNKDNLESITSGIWEI